MQISRCCVRDCEGLFGFVAHRRSACRRDVEAAMIEGRMLLQSLAHAAFAAGLVVFSTWPSYRPLPDDQALMRLSMSVSGNVVGECRIVPAPELSRLSPNMRTTEVCPRGRAPVRVELALDGRTVVDSVVPARGIARDGAAVIYRRIPVTAGEHRLEVRVDPDADRPGTIHERVQSLTLPAGTLLTIDFDLSRGGVVLR